MKVSFFLFHFVLFVICVLTFLSGCSPQNKRVEVITSTPDVFATRPAQSIQVKLVCDL
jgi:hypothetical protein